MQRALTLILAAALVGCGQMTPAVTRDAGHSDADGEPRTMEPPGALDAPGPFWGDADGDGDVDIEPVVSLVTWGGVLSENPDGPAPRDLEPRPSTLTVWPDLAVLELLAVDPATGGEVVVWIEVDGDLQPGELCTYAGCEPGMVASVSFAGCDATEAEALGFFAFAGSGATFAFQFVGGCSVQITGSVSIL